MKDAQEHSFAIMGVKIQRLIIHVEMALFKGHKPKRARSLRLFATMCGYLRLRAWMSARPWSVRSASTHEMHVHTAAMACAASPVATTFVS